MAIVRGRFLKTLSTDCALESLFTGVDAPPMILHGPLLVEGFRAEITGKPLQPLVQSLVATEVRMVRKTTVAQLAGVPFLRPVHLGHVRVQMTLRLLLFTAFGAQQLGRPG